MTAPCTVCSRTAEQIKRKSTQQWECSHVDCPNRKHAVELDHHDPQNSYGGFHERPSGAADGCYRARPTTED